MQSDFQNQAIPTYKTTSSGVLGAQSAQLAPQSGISSAFTSADQAAEMVLQAVSALRDRLDSGGALRPSTPSPQADGRGVAAEAVSGIAGRLRDQAKRLDVAREILIDIHNRIDL